MLYHPHRGIGRQGRAEYLGPGKCDRSAAGLASSWFRRVNFGVSRTCDMFQFRRP